MRTVLAFAPVAFVVLVLGTGIGALLAFVPAAGWPVVGVFAMLGSGLMIGDAIDTWRRNRGPRDG